MGIDIWNNRTIIRIMPHHSLEHHQQAAAKLRATFTDRRIRMSVRQIGETLGYKPTSIGGIMNEIHHLILLNVIEHDESNNQYYLVEGETK
jgi:competence transcription factor ComK